MSPASEQLEPLLPLLTRVLRKRPSPATAWRWVNRGVKTTDGRVKLRALRIGGGIYATAEDVQAFIDAQNPPTEVVEADGPRDDATTRRLESAGLL